MTTRHANNLRPLPNETQPEHFDRCFALAPGDNTDAKTSACLSAWRDSRPYSKDAPFRDNFILSPDRIVFAEHDVPGRDGETDHYDKQALVKVIAKLNDRIDDTGDYSPITDGHTPSPEEKSSGIPDPPILGYATNYRLAKIGNLRPRYAIVCDEWHAKDRAAELKSKPRRSVEVWLHDDMAERYFDPIAALGASTPKLDLGMKFAKAADGRTTIAKYSALAGGSNVSIPAVEPLNKERYAMDPATIDALCAALIPKLIAALKAEPAEEPTPDPNAVTPQPADPNAKPAPDATTPTPNPDDEAKYEAEECEDDDMKEDFEKYAKEARELRQNYAKAERSLADMKAELDALKARESSQVAKTREAEHRVQYAKLQAEGYQFDLEEEVAETKDFTDDQFSKHVAKIHKNYSKVSYGAPRLPIPDAKPASNAQDEARREVAVHDAKEMYQRERNEGKSPVFKEVLKRSYEKHGVKVA